MIGVCVPAHDEEALIGDCLASVATAVRHPALGGERVAVVVVLDACTDATAEVAGRWPVIKLPVHQCNVGAARHHGAWRLLADGARWLAFTDADSLVSPDWLAEQLAARADVVCGTVAVADWSPFGARAALARAGFEAGYVDRERVAGGFATALGRAAAA